MLNMTQSVNRKIKKILEFVYIMKPIFCEDDTPPYSSNIETKKPPSTFTWAAG